MVSPVCTREYLLMTSNAKDEELKQQTHEPRGNEKYRRMDIMKIGIKDRIDLKNEQQRGFY